MIQTDLMKRLSLVYAIAAMYRVYGRKHDMFIINSLIQFISGIRQNEVDRLLDEIVMGKLNPAFFDSYEV